MLPADYASQNCSIARTLELVGERWSLLIVRELFMGTRRFDDFQRNLGIARNVLQTRLERLTEQEIIDRDPYQEHPPRYEYRLTKKGTDLWPIVVAMLKWGDRYAAPAGPPVILEHKGCGGAIDDRRRCVRCGAEVEAWDVTRRPGPGMAVSEGPPGAGAAKLSASRSKASARARAAGRPGSRASRH